MRIAVIAWGALLWQPGPLALGAPWAPDGPRLPLELARIAGDGRLTLVLYPAPGAAWLPTSWAPAAGEALAVVVEHLREAERTVPGHIGSLPPHAASPAHTEKLRTVVTTATPQYRIVD